MFKRSLRKVSSEEEIKDNDEEEEEEGGNDVDNYRDPLSSQGQKVWKQLYLFRNTPISGKYAAIK